MCGETFFTTLLPLVLRPTFLGGECSHRLQPRRSAPKKGKHPIQNVLTESQRVILRGGHYHEEHEGHEVKSDSETRRDLRVLRGSEYYSMSLEPMV